MENELILAAAAGDIESIRELGPNAGPAELNRALARAAPGDAVVIAGKGHEDYQIVGEEVLHFDDREEARKALRDLGYGGREPDEM